MNAFKNFYIVNILAPMMRFIDHNDLAKLMMYYRVSQMRKAVEREKPD